MIDDSATGQASPSGRIPAGTFLELPKPTVDGEITPPMPVNVVAEPTPKDALGHRWILLRATDGTVTLELRLPWRMAPQIGMAIASKLAAAASKVDAEEGSGPVILDHRCESPAMCWADPECPVYSSRRARPGRGRVPRDGGRLFAPLSNGDGARHA